MFITRLISCLGCLLLVYGGKCPKYPLIKDFDFKQYMGLWHQQDKQQSSWEVPGRCWKTIYWRNPKNGQFKMTMVFENSLTGKEETYDSQITLKIPDEPSVIVYSIPLTFLDDKFQVIATDYDTFSVEYKCDPNGLFQKQESVFLLTRQKNPSPLVLQRAYAIMHRYGIDIRRLTRVDQTCGGMSIKEKEMNEQTESEYYSTYESEDKGSHDTYDYYDAPSAGPSRRIEQDRIGKPTPKRSWLSKLNFWG